MKQCPDCRAPNPRTRTTCYACGQSLDRRSVNPNAPLPGERTYECVNCAAAIPYRANACPGCGRVVTVPPAPPVAPGTPPPAATWGDPEAGVAATASLSLEVARMGWEVEPLPDGSVRLRRTTGSRLNRAAGPVGVALFMAVYFAFQGFHSAALGGRVEPRISAPLILLLAVAGTVAAAYLFWVFTGKDELRAGPGFLEVRRELWHYRRMERMTLGVLRAETNETYARNHRRVYRRLLAQNLGKRIVLDQVERGFLILGGMKSDPVSALGAYLSRVTGFALVDPENGRY